MRFKRTVTGLHPATVISNVDPDHSGRILISPSWKGRFVEVWARLATPSAGNDSGTWWLPGVGDEVLVGFTEGDIHRPYVVGSLWNGDDRKPPVSADEAQEVDRIRTVGGSVIDFDRSSGSEVVTIATEAGQRIELDPNSTSVTIDNGAGTTISLDPSGVEIDAPTVTVNASIVTVDAATASFAGIIQADTIVATNVVASNYTPGAGNVH